MSTDPTPPTLMSAVRSILPGRWFEPTAAVLESPQLRGVLDGAVREATHLEHDMVGVEHLLLALIADPHSPAGATLTALGAPTLDRARAIVATRTSDIAPRTGRHGYLPLTPRARKILNRAAAAHSNSAADSADVLAALAHGGGVATSLIAEWAITQAITASSARTDGGQVR